MPFVAWFKTLSASLNDSTTKLIYRFRLNENTASGSSPTFADSSNTSVIKDFSKSTILIFLSTISLLISSIEFKISDRLEWDFFLLNKEKYNSSN